LEVINFNQVDPGPIVPQLLEARADLRRELIIACPYFNVERIELEAETAFNGCCNGQTFEIWGMMAGQGQVDWNWREPLELTAVQFTLLPAALGDFTIEATKPSVLLRVYMPELGSGD
jgi:mannose-6-phosphate isomerase